MDPIKAEIKNAVDLRKSNHAEDALHILLNLLRDYPNHPDINYQIACTYDSIGIETEAIGYYEKAIAGGLTEGKAEAMLGLGSSYRCTGEYEKSLSVFDRALIEFPQMGALKTFKSLTLYNLGKGDEAIATLLTQLIETTNDASIRKYEAALRFYSDKLEQVWK